MVCVQEPSDIDGNRGARFCMDGGDKMEEMIILVPGVGLGGLEMALLARRLRRLGYAARTFWHWPWGRTLSEAATALHQAATSCEQEVVHFVGHSYGGLVVAQMFIDYPAQRPGRLVTLATPHNGSVAATRVAALPLGRHLLGRGLASALASGPLPLPDDREVGAIAGDLNLLLGFLLRLPRPNDTVVGVAETRHPQATASVTVRTSHAGLLASRRVVRHIDSFLQTGAFAADLTGTRAGP